MGLVATLETEDESMAAEDEKISIELLGKIARECLDGITKLSAQMTTMDQRVENTHQRIENIDAALSRMHADVVDAKATGKEVAVRLTLVEHRMGSIQSRLDRIEAHLGPVNA
jgi:chromosome segregation ATPase